MALFCEYYKNTLKHAILYLGRDGSAVVGVVYAVKVVVDVIVDVWMLLPTGDPFRE